MRYDSITDAIGNTPLLRIDPSVHRLRHVDLYAKLEMLNPFGSVKDRAAWSMVRATIEDAGREGRTVIELSSGNTAKALAVIAGMHGVRFRSVTNRMKVPEVKDLLHLIGAEIEELPGQAECLDPTNVDDPLTMIHQQVGSDPSYLHTDQYYNPRNTQAHVETTGPEILRDLDGNAPDYFIACVGTAGSSTGIAQVLRAARPDIRVIGLVAQKSDFVPGIRNIDEVHEVGLFDPEIYDEIEAVSADEAIDGTLELVRRCGLLAGPTGGAAYHGATRHLRKVDDQLEADGAGERRTAVFVVCDRVESYMSYFRARRPELLGDRSGPRVTATAEQVAAARTLDPAQAAAWIADAGPLVVDLRGGFAYSTSHIAGAVNVPDELFADLVRGGLPFPRTRPVLLACPVGEQSRRWAAVLTGLGHPDARSLDGGIVAWRDAGQALERN
ncbi:pyridoxal-phosphate dependent enzyme [Geodermatophilus sp. DSM 44513]|uniref:pyridoxal-phosphate dependent enzyme n=1 Tax=Geodermatophilus sp. DSM 44513 TaxID=1528104 RepID=UPI00126D2592|nr:pyridoxal-phosphate dependent enzyme [Geodermatophilus sp. DSM 44513]WNV77622.1 pyridoxal-phosphate dependent enzyme [Geodermatophilus sp. DSM 44513]